MSKTLPKHDWNLNCLSYGSNLLIKLDSVDILRAQFDRFESHFRNNENVIYDKKIPLFIMEMFSKLWKLWIDFPELHEVITRSSFYDVFEEMSSYFASEKDQSGQTAAACGAISIAPVEKTRQPAATHYVLLDKFEGCGLYPPQPSKPFAVPRSNLTLNKVNRPPTAFVNLSRPDPENSQSIEMEPCLSNNSSRSMKSATNEIENFQSNAMLRSSTPCENFHLTGGTFNKNNVLFKSPSPGDMHCGPCCRSVIDETIEEHLDSAKHRKHVELMKEVVRCFDKNRHVLTLQDERTMLFSCKACVKIQEGTNCLIQHCNSKNHLNKVMESLKGFSFAFPSSVQTGLY